MIIPPSPVVITLRGWKEKTTRSECAPIGSVPMPAPIAHAASSTTVIPAGSHNARTPTTSAGTPPWCTRMTARVLVVITASIVAAVRLPVEISTSAKTGVAPT